jgi:DNA-binding transcriptional MerR regulator
MRYLHTSDLAKAVGAHPNTVRRYVDRGILPPVERSPNGYRRFTQRHLDCMRLARQVYSGQYPGKAIFQSGVRIVRAAVAGDLGGALELAYSHLALVHSEHAQADAAAALLERWAFGTPPAAGACGNPVPAFSPAARAPASAPAAATIQPLRIGQVARLLGVSIDIVRSWDRNGLIDVPRDPVNGYRSYGAREISRLRVIRMLSRAGYSLAAILRMLIQLDRGETADLRRALDTPRPNEDVYLASDRWLSTLTEQEQRARTIISLVEEIIHNHTSGAC